MLTAFAGVVLAFFAPTANADWAVDDDTPIPVTRITETTDPVDIGFLACGSGVERAPEVAERGEEIFGVEATAARCEALRSELVIVGTTAAADLDQVRAYMNETFDCELRVPFVRALGWFAYPTTDDPDDARSATGVLELMTHGLRHRSRC